MEWLRTATAVRIFVIVTLATNVVARPENNAHSSPIILRYEDTNASMDSGFNPKKAFADPIAAVLQSEIELSISEIYRLGDDTGLKTSSIRCTIHMQSDLWDKHYSTEVIIDNHYPQFVEKIRIPYLFGEKQTLNFTFHSVSDLSNPNVEGLPEYAKCSLGKLVQLGSMKLQLKKEHSHGKDDDLRGYIIIKIEKVISERIILELSGRNLANKKWYEILSPYIEIYKPTEANEEVLMYRTEVSKKLKKLDTDWISVTEIMIYPPEWKRITMHSLGMCDGNHELILKFVCWNWDAKERKRDFIGEFEASLEQMKHQKPDALFDLQNTRRKETQLKYKNSGQIMIASFGVQEVPSLAEFLRGGLKIHCTIAIDFTDSNGEPKMPNSLHHQDPTNNVLLNPYEELLMSFGTVIEEYNESFSVKGFGARFRDDDIDTVHHDFNVNLTKSPRCFGARGILETYRKCLDSIVLSGPKFYDLIIRSASQTTREFKGRGDDYLILLILTNGSVTNAMQFREAIQSARDLPIFIILVSVDGKSSRAKETLDLANSKEFKALGQRVQFIQYDQQDHRTSGSSLAREVLGKVQWNVTSYMKSRDYKPKSPLFAHPPITDES